MSAPRAGVPIRVVVVDDQPLERTGNALILDSDDGIEVIGEAGDGAAAIQLIDRDPPDVVLMDVRMPVMDGLEATRIITEGHPGVRVVVLTTFDLDAYAFGALRAGASAFLLKSTRPQALIDAVRTVAEGDAVAAPGLTSRLIEHYLGSAGAPAPGAPSESDHAGDGPAGPAGPAAARAGAASDRLAALSPRERDVFTAIVRGLTNSEIAETLFVAPSTVKSHVNAVFAKLGLRDRVHAVILGYELGLAP